MTMLVTYLLVLCVAGVLVVRLHLAPLVGFLLAGFALKALGLPEIPGLEKVGDIGVTILLFSIGLKLDLKLLVRREVVVTALVHLLVSIAVLTGVLLLLGVVHFAPLANLALDDAALLGFALSFSSTVLVVKILEERGQSASFHGRVAVGILIIQDIVAVLFIAISEQHLPSPWALLLFGFIPLRKPLGRALAAIQHLELQVLLVLLTALGPGYWLFHTLGIKGDLGALVMGALLAGTPVADTFARRAGGLKDLFLVAFFVSIGFAGLPSLGQLALALLLLLLLPLKGWAFAQLLRLFGLDRRAMGQAGLALANYSEFGLIVAAIAVQSGWLGPEWLPGVATIVATSFVASSAGEHSKVAQAMWRRIIPPEPSAEKLHPECAPISLGEANAIVIGMGRVGREAAERLSSQHGLRVIGLEQDRDLAAELCIEGFHVREADACDPDLWQRVDGVKNLTHMVLALPQVESCIEAMEALKRAGFTGISAAAVRHADDEQTLLDHGIDLVTEFHAAAGANLVDDLMAGRRG